MSGGLLGVGTGIGKAQRKGQMITWFSASAPSDVQTLGLLQLTTENSHSDFLIYLSVSFH